MLGTRWECHKVREFALRPMGDWRFFTGVGPYGNKEIKKTAVSK